MKSTLVWIILGGALLFFGGSVDAWSRQFFNRFSRNPFQNSDLTPATNNDLNDFKTLFGLGSDRGRERAGIRGLGRDSDGAEIGDGFRQQQPEVYGIVEPLIEDLPCVDRPCNVNDDCCPSGVCMPSYGERKCIYDFGRKHDLCRRHTDCEPGMSCLKGAAGNLFCQPPTSILAAAPATNSLAAKQPGEDCVTSSDCNVNNFMCCQLHRTHHRMLPQRRCAFFRDPFMCIDISPAEDEDSRDPRYISSSVSQRLM